MALEIFSNLNESMAIVIFFVVQMIIEKEHDLF